MQTIEEILQGKYETFESASISQKRVLIALDVIEQLTAKRYIPNTGYFIKNSQIDHLHRDTSVQLAFARKEIETCEVCALGSVFMSCINYHNQSVIYDLLNEKANIGFFISTDFPLSNSLTTFFTREQLILIELYFENNKGYFFYSDDEGILCRDNVTIVNLEENFSKKIDLNHINQFNTKYIDNETRLRLIMANIIVNNGTFVPENLPI